MNSRVVGPFKYSIVLWRQYYVNIEPIRSQIWLGLCLRYAPLWRCLAGKSPDIQSFQYQYQSTTVGKMYVGRFLIQLLQKPSDFLQHVRTSSFIIFLETVNILLISFVLLLSVLPHYRWHTASRSSLIAAPISSSCQWGYCRARDFCQWCFFVLFPSWRMVPQCQVPE